MAGLLSEKVVYSTCMFLAAKNGHEDMMEFFLNNGIDDAHETFKSHALSIASQHGHDNIVKLLKYHKAQPYTPTMCNCGGLCEAAISGRAAPSSSLASATEKCRCTALFYAASNGNEAVIRQLLSPGNAADEAGILAAVVDDNAQRVREEVEGGDLEIRNDNGETPIMIACQQGNAEITEVLIESGAYLGVRTSTDDTLLHTAVSKGHRSIVELLINNDVNCNLVNADRENAFHYACRHGDEAIVRMLLGKMEDLNACNARNDTALHIAVREGHYIIVQILLDNSADITIKNNEGDTALHTAAIKGNEGIIKMLLQNGADANAKNITEHTPLHLAAKFGFVSKSLIGVAEIDSQNCAGDTALHLAVEGEHKKVVAALIKKGASVIIRNMDGFTAAEIASSDDIVSIIRSAE